MSPSLMLVLLTVSLMLGSLAASDSGASARQRQRAVAKATKDLMAAHLHASRRDLVVHHMVFPLMSRSFITSFRGVWQSVHGNMLLEEQINALRK